jgi:excisionase family DNA binding protein
MPQAHAPTIAQVLEHILALRRTERELAPEVHEDIAAARAFLEDSVGPTVRQAEAARLLGVSRPSLLRWLDKGDIASIQMPTGRREIPLPELLDLLERLEPIRAAGHKRPLARVLHERRRQAEKEIDLNRLLPRRAGYRTAELQSLAYHRLVAERLDDELLTEARRRLQRWRNSGRVDARWADEWERLLNLPRSRLAKAIAADTPRARQLRQASPFAGALNEHERRRLADAVTRRG